MWRLVRRQRGCRSQFSPVMCCCCCCFGSVGIKMVVPLRQVKQCRDLCMHMCHLPWSYCRAEQQTSGFQIAAELLCTRGGCDNPNGWPSTATPLPVASRLCA